MLTANWTEEASKSGQVRSFANLIWFDRIYVTGPQRSGTTICARMICHDTGYEFRDSEKHNRHDGLWMRKRNAGRTRFVQHCPFLARTIGQVSAVSTLVVYLRRDIRDIIKSQHRINWRDGKERARWPGATWDTIAERKYAYWETRQRQHVRHWLEVQYESLRDHPLWVPKKRRRGFGKRQWRE